MKTYGTKTALYEAIKPELRALGEKCAHGEVQFFAVVELDKGNGGDYLMTSNIADEEASVAFLMIRELARAHGDFDKFMEFVEYHARRNGHNSRTLARLGIPTTPGPDRIGGTGTIGLMPASVK